LEGERLEREPAWLSTLHLLHLDCYVLQAEKERSLSTKKALTSLASHSSMKRLEGERPERELAWFLSLRALQLGVYTSAKGKIIICQKVSFAEPLNQWSGFRVNGLNMKRIHDLDCFLAAMEGTIIISKDASLVVHLISRAALTWIGLIFKSSGQRPYFKGSSGYYWLGSSSTMNPLKGERLKYELASFSHDIVCLVRGKDWAGSSASPRKDDKARRLLPCCNIPFEARGLVYSRNWWL
jgi:hypothetical protein